MLRITNIGTSKKNRVNYWPVVAKFDGFSDSLQSLLQLDNAQLKAHFTSLHQSNFEEYSQLVMKSLGTIYAGYFGYQDSPFENADDELYLALIRLKLFLEHEMLGNIIKPQALPQINSAEEFYEYLAPHIKETSGAHTKFFDFVAQEMTLEQMREFLLIEVIRNEVVEDEVAMIIPGLGGHALKQAMASNLWDECGSGNIDNFHTTWLYELIEAENAWEKIIEYRKTKPWFTGIASNSFNSLLTGHKKKLRSFGHFLVTEAWVFPHFVKIIEGMNRLGIDDNRIRIYFNMHIKIDPHHAEEMLTSILQNKPALGSEQLIEILQGAHQAFAAGSLMYEKLLNHFKK